MPPEGLERPRDSAGKTPIPKAGGIKSGNNRAEGGSKVSPAAPAKTADPDLSAIIAAWPTLPAAIRAGVLALVKAAVAAP